MTNFDKKVKNKFLFGIFLFVNLPMAWIAGLKLNDFNHSQCSVYLKHSYLNQNPFKSIYWACQGMAAELSTGLLAFRYIDMSGKKISLLVIDVKSKFFKKAIGKVIFNCNDGLLIQKTIQKRISEQKPQTCLTNSVGFDESNNMVSSFEITWSFKLK